jgi:DNA-binding NtrC family response regulator
VRSLKKGGNMSKPKILICDDEEGVRESLKLILEQKFDCHLVTNGQECLDFIKENPDVRLAVMDIKMPKVDGINAVKQIKKINPKVKMMMVTGYRSVETAAEAVKAGASEYTIKPFDSKEILEKAEKLLAT